MVALPRLVVAAPASGHGKTTVATGLMAALRATGHVVSGHKVGPDYIDPGYHALATGRPGRNLDPHLVGEELVAPLLLHGSRSPRPADLAVIEGVMGLYDGALGREGFASTAHVAALLQAPVVLVVDISHASRSIAAVVHGMLTFDHRVRVAGVILNKAGSERHATEVAQALKVIGVDVLGVLRRDDGISAPSRHLGLVPVDERADAAASLRQLAGQIAERVDLEAVVRIARSAPPLAGPAWDPVTALGHRGPPVAGPAPVVAVAGGRAFTFRYAETEELLHAAGLRTAWFDPMVDSVLPEGTAGIYLGGGFPEVHASGLSANVPLRKALRAAVASGVPTVAECAGLLYLCRSMDGAPMVGALDAEAAMTPRLTLSYHAAVAPQETLLAAAGGRMTGHEFHRTTVVATSPAVPAWLLGGKAAGFSADPGGTGRPTLHASYLHTHWAGHPQAAARFARAVRGAPPFHSAVTTTTRPVAAPTTADPGGADVDLLHHGDRELGADLVDLAVNVATVPRPGWLEAALVASLGEVGSYPDTSPARDALAARHVRAAEEVLPTAGAAEAFTLVARVRRWDHPVVVHPQFTEPEAALRAAGQHVDRVLLRESDGFRIDPHAVPDSADLVVIGNPTNPTGVLHPSSALRALARRGRTLVVDEAFMDAVPGERQSMASTRLPGLLVVRSLTKTWSIPGVRAGYVLGDPAMVAALAGQQPPWSVSSSAVAAMVACSSAEAILEADRRARETAHFRRLLVTGLADLGLPVVGSPAASFVLVRVPVGLREALREEGFAVRRGDTFPGLGPDWVRIAVREPDTTRRLLAAVARSRPGAPATVDGLAEHPGLDAALR